MFCGLCEEACPTEPTLDLADHEDLRGRRRTSATRSSTSTCSSSKLGRGVPRRDAESRAVPDDPPDAPKASRGRRRTRSEDPMELAASLFASVLAVRRGGGRRRRRRDRAQEPRALGALPAVDVPHGRGALRPPPRRVPGGGPGAGLRGRHHGPLPLRHHAGQRQGRSDRRPPSCTRWAPLAIVGGVLVGALLALLRAARRARRRQRRRLPPCRPSDGEPSPATPRPSAGPSTATTWCRSRSSRCSCWWR